jgi:hypothetical protein
MSWINYEVPHYVDFSNDLLLLDKSKYSPCTVLILPQPKFPHFAEGALHTRHMKLFSAHKDFNYVNPG